MKRCAHWEAVSIVTVQTYEDTQFPGMYAVSVRHMHKATDVAVTDIYGALTWQEACSVSDAALGANQPGFRHLWLSHLQDTLWGQEGTKTL